MSIQYFILLYVAAVCTHVRSFIESFFFERINNLVILSLHKRSYALLCNVATGLLLGYLSCRI